MVFSVDNSKTEWTFIETPELKKCKVGYTCTKPPGLLLEGQVVKQKAIELTGNPTDVSILPYFLSISYELSSFTLVHYRLLSQKFTRKGSKS